MKHKKRKVVSLPPRGKGRGGIPSSVTVPYANDGSLLVSTALLRCRTMYFYLAKHKGPDGAISRDVCLWVSVFLSDYEVGSSGLFSIRFFEVHA